MSAKKQQDRAKQRNERLSLTPIFISIDDAARMLGIGRTSVYELMAAGDIRFVNVGRRRLIAEAEVRGYAARLLAASA